MFDEGEDERDSSPTDRKSLLENDLKSQFSHLHERLDNRHQATADSNTETPQFSPADRPPTQAESNTTPRADNKRTDSESLERLRELFDKRVTAPSSPVNRSPPESRFTGQTKLYLGIALGVIAATLLPGVVLVSSAHLSDTIFAPSPTEYVDSGDTLYIETDEAAYLSRIFEETTHEVAYCGLITNDAERPRLKVWMANTVNAGPTEIEFITENCPGAVQEVLLHTHPSGILQLSEKDREALEEGPEEIMCVQGGSLATEPGAVLDNLVCYKQQPGEDGGGLSKILVVLTDIA